MKHVSWAPGWTKKRISASAVSSEIDKLAKKNRGSITPTIIVEAARDEESPLHQIFDWDDEVAAEQWRLHSARHMLNHLVVRVAMSDGTNEHVKAYHCVSSSVVDNDESSIGRVYLPLSTAMSSASVMAAIVSGALAELAGWQRRYGHYVELKQVSDHVGRAIRSKKSRRKDKED